MIRNLGEGWKTIRNNQFEANILSFDEPSVYGICGGRISKLFIRDMATGNVVCNYDRGWDIKPDCFAPFFYYEILEKYN